MLVKIIRVALLEMKSRLRDILTDAIANEDDMELMAYQSEPPPDRASVAPDAVVWEVDDPLDVALADRLLRTFPRARALMIAGSGDRAALYELLPRRMAMVDVSIGQLVEALRAGIDDVRISGNE